MAPQLFTLKTGDATCVVRDALVQDMEETWLPDVCLTRQTRFFFRPDLFFFSKTSTHPLAPLVGELIEDLKDIPMAAPLVALAQQLEYRIEFVNLEGFCLDVQADQRQLAVGTGGLSSSAILRSVYFRNELQIEILRGLRQIFQIENGHIPRYLKPDQAVLCARILAADEAAWLVDLLFQKREEQPELWRHILGSDIGDIAACYARGQESDKISLLDVERRRVPGAGFLLWFRDETRMNICDHTTLEQIDDQMKTTKTRGLYRACLTPDMVRLICNDSATNQTYLDENCLGAVFSPLCQSPLNPINAQYLAQIIQEQDGIIINNIGFRDRALARMVFPDNRE